MVVERAQQDVVEHYEHGRGRCDPDRQDQHDRERKAAFDGEAAGSGGTKAGRWTCAVLRVWNTASVETFWAVYSLVTAQHESGAGLS